MTIAISSGMAASLAAAGTENNPMILWRNRSVDGTWTQSLGVEIESPTNLLTGTTYDRWISTYSGGGFAQAQLVLPANRTMNMACVAAHTISDFGGTVSLQTSIDSGSNWVDSGAGTVTPTDNQAIFFVFNETPTTNYWRLRISGGTTGELVSVGVFFLGKRLTVPQRIYQGYMPPITPTRVDLQSNVSEGGNLLGSSVIRKGSSAVANLTHLLPSFIRDNGADDWVPFQNHFNNGGGAFWAWRPTQFEDAFYAWRSGPPIMPTNSGPKGYMSAQIEMRMFDDP